MADKISVSVWENPYAQQVMIDNPESYQDLLDTLRRGGKVAARPFNPSPPPVDPIKQVADADLILELIARGYAVWKPPVGA